MGDSARAGGPVPGGCVEEAGGRIRGRPPCPPVGEGDSPVAVPFFAARAGPAGFAARKFFVPYAADDDHSEQIWCDARADLFGLGLPTTRRRIWALALDVRQPHSLLHIGRKVPQDEGPAMVILEASRLDLYYVCTPWRGVLGGEPHIFGLTERGRAIDFAGSASGKA